LAAGAVATSEVPRKHGVPLFLAFIGCGVVLRSWALGTWVTVVLGFTVEQAITGRFQHFSPSGNGDNLAGEWAYAVLLYATIGAVAILLGMALAALIRFIGQPPRGRPTPRA